MFKGVRGAAFLGFALAGLAVNPALAEPLPKEDCDKLKLEEAALKDSYFVERKLYPNVDFYSGIIMRALGIPVEMFTVMFAIGRMPGWIANYKKRWKNPRASTGRARFTSDRRSTITCRLKTGSEDVQRDAGNPNDSRSKLRQRSLSQYLPGHHDHLVPDKY